MSAYYNEIDSFCVQWLRNLIAAGHIAAGEVDERSIIEVRPDDLLGFDQCHFFAGIGGWSYALRLAGWPDGRPVWTGSAPCQPFSAAGAQRGSDDARHLWPAWFRLIRECRPCSVFGEQVAGTSGLAWLDHVCADLEGAGYAAAAANLPAAGVGAPHIRQRLYWMAHAERDDSERKRFDVGAAEGSVETEAQQRQWLRDDALAGEHSDELADATIARRGAQPQRDAGTDGRPPAESGRLRDAGDVAHAAGERCEGRIAGAEHERGRDQVLAGGGGGLADAREGGCAVERTPRLHDRRQSGDDAAGCGALSVAQGDAKDARLEKRDAGRLFASGFAGPIETGAANQWDDVEWLPCRDGKARPTQPGLFPLAHGIPGRVGRLRAYGNAIVPPLAAEFIKAVMECRP